MPESGRLVAGGGHLHGGGVRLALRNATCGTTAFESRPTWGGPKPRPLLHEPGPTKMSAFQSTEGIPVAKGQRLRLAAVYENHAPHTRVMGIMLLFLAPGAGVRLPGDAEARGRPRPALRRRPRSRCRCRARRRGRCRRRCSTWVGDFRYGAERISIRRGSTFTWRFVGAFPHDVTVSAARRASRRRGRRAGTFKHRFTKPGTYRLFCSLHPAKMVQQITVR